MEGIKCIINGTEERTQHAGEVKAVLCYLVTAIRRPTTSRRWWPNPDFKFLGHDAPPSPSPGRIDMPTADGAAAAFARRSAALRLSFSCEVRMNNSAPSSTRRNHLPASWAAFRHPSNFIPNGHVLLQMNLEYTTVALFGLLLTGSPLKVS